MNALNKTLVLVSALTLSLVAAGCGKNPLANIVSNVTLKTYQENGDAFGEVKTLLDTGSIQLPAIDLPIVDPRNPIVSYGKISTKWDITGKTALAIAVNLTEVAKVPGGTAKLPNGTALPVGGVDSANVIELPIKNTSAKVYLAFDKDVLLVGTAIPIKEFNGLGQYVGGVNLFTGFNLVNGVKGIAGIFTSQQPGQSGIGLFIDASSLLKPTPQPGTMTFAMRAIPVEHGRPLTFNDLKPSKSKEDRIKRHVYDMHVRAVRTHLN